MPNLSVSEALDLLARCGDDVARTRAEARASEARRDAVIRALDGQAGITRLAMAQQCGLSKSAVHLIVGRAKPEREQMADGVPMDADLYAYLVDVLGSFATTFKGSEAVRLDVDA